MFDLIYYKTLFGEKTDNKTYKNNIIRVKKEVFWDEKLYIK